MMNYHNVNINVYQYGISRDLGRCLYYGGDEWCGVKIKLLAGEIQVSNVAIMIANVFQLPISVKISTLLLSIVHLFSDGLYDWYADFV
ncbi:hypothetical protein [Neisseria montereyensis]|uniref:Uncharacterized protein n=1 Tax=Neisseria montereyensis TaxID=2973938 RepID=A0ABT2FEK8_9NEIS|nr:hypothetical protein [Neisseria montereyensis]MCS4534642.1 hypothetical protein [Neisseria montereyensis]